MFRILNFGFIIMPDIFVSPASGSSETSPPKNRKPKTISQALSAFLFMPEEMRFETQEQAETIILLLRKHWITNFFWLFISFILLITPLILFPAVSFSGLIAESISGSYISFIILAWYLGTFSYILVNFLLWYFTVSIVTNDRIVDIDFFNILHKKFAETKISRIEDVTMKTGGFIRSIFDCGDVFVQTAAKEAMFQFEAVPHPEKVVRIINGLMGKASEVD